MNSELIRLILIVCSVAVVSQAEEPSASPSLSPSPSLSASPAASPFEEPPTLSASQILKPEFLSGPHFKVHDEVTTYSGGNHYLIDSDFGPFDAESNEMLRIRISEIDAIAKLQEVSKTDEFKTALERAAKGPYKTAKQLIADPVGTISGIPKGAWKSLNSIGQSLKERLSGRTSASYEDSTVQSVIGFSRAKRELATRLGVNPYSSNSVLQKELNSIAWASFAGELPVTVASFGISGAAGNALTGLSWTEDLNKTLIENDPSDVHLINLRKLVNLGISKTLSEEFVQNPAFNPLSQSVITAALVKLARASGKQKFISLATTADNEVDALFFQQCAALLVEANQKLGGVARITSFQRLPCCVTKDNTFVVAIQYDYLAWTEQVATAAEKVLNLKNGKESYAAFVLFTSGDLSLRAREELTQRGIKIYDRQLPGPLR
jgi:hypothetical protein